MMNEIFHEKMAVHGGFKRLKHFVVTLNWL